MYFFTADEHYGHANIIRYCRRPFSSVGEMDRELIERHNAAVGAGDTVVHAGDFTLQSPEEARGYIARLNGRHIFIRGSHDYWLGPDAHELWEETVEGRYIVVCHYAMRVWPRSHYNSWQLYGHSHGRLEPVGKQWDVGVDANGFAPVSLERLDDIMAARPDNPGLVRSRQPGRAKEERCKHADR
ncbi:MAG TPA: metallophosphoesterase [bacterium]|nr:metallophosphoesterase [bacterium]HPJ71375.1 metallophosphoesterase [bacterium]HPQ66433.1 metallophosphoesterase [bacterium]